ncbi:MAG TPA: HlyD family secretion protein [Paraburkholderia sp.]|jgi:HlyD family type I secretion membrane fusion protein|nr:HlyD family secretion protein [Paraburkholderia sp.]
MMELRRAAADYQSRQQSDAAELIRSRQKQTDLELKIATLRNDYVKSADSQLKDTTAKILQITEQLRPAQDVDTRTRIVAPVAGEVVGLRVHTIGASIGPREPILDLVPTGVPLIVEAKIKPDNVREIVPNSKADVRLTAYNPRTSPVLEGTVTYLSADALNDKDTRQPFYLAHIEVSAKAIAKANRLAKEPIVLGPGLRAEVFIKTRSRSAFDYLFEPVWDGIQRSMRD